MVPFPLHFQTKFCIEILINFYFFDDKKYLNLRKEKETVAKQLSILQVYRYRYIYSSKKVKAENFFLNMAQLGNIFP